MSDVDNVQLQIFVQFHHDIIFFVWNQILWLCPFHEELGIWEWCPSVLVPTYHLWFPFIVYSLCIVVFINKLRTRNNDYANSVRYVSQQRGQARFPCSCLSGFREIVTHAFIQGTSLDGALGHSYCCDFGSLLLKTIFKC